MRLFSGNYPEQGVVEFNLSELPPPLSPEYAESWARFPLGVAYILQREGFKLKGEWMLCSMGISRAEACLAPLLSP